jgi:hypothetical protein
VNVTFTKTGDLTSVTDALAGDAKAGAKAAGKLVARDVKKLILAGAKGAGVKRRFAGKTLNVKYRLHAGDSSSVVETYASPAGAWSILEDGRRGGYTVKPRRAKVLAYGRGKGDVVGLHATPSGVTGRHVWTRATAELEDELEPIVRKALDQALGV